LAEHAALARTLQRFCATWVVLATAPPAATLAAQEQRLDHYGLGPERLRALCAPTQSVDPATLGRLQHNLEARVRDAGAREAAWRSYGCVLSLLYAAARQDGRELSRLAVPAVRAFAKVLERDPGDELAAAGLATLAFDLSEGPDLATANQNAESFAALAYGSVKAGVRTPIVLRMCTEFAFVTSDITTARYCIDRALAAGRDSSWQLIRAAWLAFLDGNRESGTALFDRAVAVAHDSAALADVGWHLRRLTGQAVLSAWPGLTDRERVEWVHGHYRRDGDDAAMTYADALARFEGDLPMHGPLFEHCPFDIVRNGAHMALDRNGCRQADDQRRPIGIIAALSRLWDPASGRPLGVLTYALDRSNLSIDATPTSRSTAVQLNWRVLEWRDGQWTDSTLEVRLPIANDLKAPPYVSGFLLVTPANGTYSWTLTARQRGDFGATSFDAAVGPVGRPFEISDVILGVPEQRLSWKLGEDSIVLAPLNTVPRHKPLELYFQVRNERESGEFTTAIVLRRISQGNIDPKPELSIKFPYRARLGIDGIHRQIDVSRATGNAHQLVVQILDRAGSVVAESNINLFIH
jgi:hypothetical protein